MSTNEQKTGIMQSCIGPFRASPRNPVPHLPTFHWLEPDPCPTSPHGRLGSEGQAEGLAGLYHNGEDRGEGNSPIRLNPETAPEVEMERGPAVKGVVGGHPRQTELPVQRTVKIVQKLCNQLYNSVMIG